MATHGAPEPVLTIDSSDEPACFQGALDQIALSSLLCILETERKTGILVLFDEPGLGKARLHLSEGRVVRAHLDDREQPRNAELVYLLLARTRGHFDFLPSRVVLGDELRCSTTRLLFEGVRRIDQRAPEPILAVKCAPLQRTLAARRHPPDAARSAARSAGGSTEALRARNSRIREEGFRARHRRNKRGTAPDASRRWASAKVAAAFASMAIFVLVVLTTVLR